MCAMTDKTILSIIIVTHNTKELLTPLLTSIDKSIKYFGKKTEIIIVDNGSSKDTLNIIKNSYPDVILISNSDNKGYARANNQGIKISSGEYILLLNSDTILDQNSIKITLEYLEKNHDVGVVTCKVLLPNGELDPACHRGFPTPFASLAYFLGLEKLFPKSKVFSNYHLLYKDLKTIHEIDSPSGAFFLTRKKVVKTVGLLDESFFMYGEDLDWSFRIKTSGWKIIYNPQTSVVHLKKQSGIKSKDLVIRKKTTTAFYEAMRIFYKKHYEATYPFFVNFFIYTMIEIRKLFDLIKLSLSWI